MHLPIIVKHNPGLNNPIDCLHVDASQRFVCAFLVLYPIVRSPVSGINMNLLTAQLAMVNNLWFFSPKMILKYMGASGI